MKFTYVYNHEAGIGLQGVFVVRVPRTYVQAKRLDGVLHPVPRCKEVQPMS